MHALILTAGSAGDVFPFIDLGRTLRARGHEVTLLTNEWFADAVRGADLEYVETGTKDEFERAISNPDLWHPRKGVDVVMREAVAPSIEPSVALLEKHRRDDTVIVHSTIGIGARILHERDGTPLASVHLAPSIFKSLHRMPRLGGLPDLSGWPRFLKRAFWWIGDKASDKHLGPAVNPIRATYGKEPVKGIMMDWAHSPDCVIGLFPEWFGTPQPDWPKHTLTGFPTFDDAGRRPIDPDLRAWIEDGEPPILFTAGSANVTADRFFAESIEACRLLNRRGILVTKKRSSLPSDMPNGIRHVEFVPFSAVFPLCAAVVGHGGIGTVARAFQAATPQLVTPMGFDQFDNGARVEEHGAGRVLPMTKYRAKRAARVLEELVGNESIRASCREVQKRMDPGAMEKTARLIEKLSPTG